MYIYVSKACMVTQTYVGVIPIANTVCWDTKTTNGTHNFRPFRITNTWGYSYSYGSNIRAI